jgi:hypothetical protein
MLIPTLAIVDAETWERANSYRTQNRVFSPRNNRAPSLLHGLVYCGRDHGGDPERRMQFIQRKGTRPTWRCRHRAAPGEPFCPGYMPAATLEAAVWEKVCSIVRCPEDYMRDVRAQFAQAREVRERRHRRKAVVDEALAKARLALDNLEVARLRGEIADEQYARLRPRLLDDEKAALAELAQAEQEVIPDVPQVQVWMYKDGGYGQVAVTAMQGMDKEQRQRKVRQFVERVVINESGAYMVGLVPSASGRLACAPSHGSRRGDTRRGPGRHAPRATEWTGTR